MKKILDKLEKRITSDPSSCFFNEPSASQGIQELEDSYDIRLPVSFKDFLKHHNGGFISLIEFKEGRDADTLAWNSNNFLSLEGISDATERISYKADALGFNFIPFLHTYGGEYLGFMNPLEEGESKVYDLWHEASAWEWKQQVVYENFAELLEDYLDRHGKIDTIG